MRLKNLILVSIVFLGVNVNLNAQDTTKAVNKQDTSSLINQLENEAAGNKTGYVTSTFKYTHIINSQSVDNLPAHVLDVRILHRFGPLRNGPYNFFGLDNRGGFNVKVGFEYGITNNLMIGGAHSALRKTYDAFFKLKILKQSEGTAKMPITVSFVPTFAIASAKSTDADNFDPTMIKSGETVKMSDRLSYVLQLLIGRKFSEGFSMQIMPTFVRTDNISFDHFKDGTYKRDIFAIGVAGAQKISKRMRVNAEYYYQLPGSAAFIARNVVAFGLGIGTGGHVFELQFSNSIGLTEKSFITETDRTGFNRGARFGFNISRVFQLGKKHKAAGTDWKK